MVLNEVQELNNTVILNGYCIGCGACTSYEGSPFKIKMNKFGNYVAYLDDDSSQNLPGILKVCPFSSQSINEDQLGKIYLPEATDKNNLLGRYYASYAGYVKNKSFRKDGSSGGIGKWIGYKLLSEGLVDHYIHVAPSNSNALFEYKIINEPDDIFSGSKSSYYPVTFDSVLRHIKNKEGTFAITGVPCFIKALRLLALHDNELMSKISFTIGLFCGGMKSANHAKMIAWQLGIEPDDLDKIDFRVKPQSGPATHKIYKVWSSKKGIESSKLSHEIFGTGWNGYFTPKACFFCDDVVSELADLSIGDAWLPKYIEDTQGTNILIVRNPTILKLIEASLLKDEIFLEELSSDEVIKSQAGGFRQRRDALSYRIKMKENKKEWYPPKRVKAGDYLLTRKRRRIYSLREKIAVKSHSSFQVAYSKKKLNYFLKRMKALEMKYLLANIGLISFLRFIVRIVLRRILLLIK